MKNLVQQLSGSLFWDVDPNTIDEEQNKRFIIQRVLEWGTRKDWLLINKRYAHEGIAQEAIQMKSLDSKALSYISCMANIPKEKFICLINK